MPTFEADDDASLTHYGILMRSGRYPWGSGQKYFGKGDASTEVGRANIFRAQVAMMKKKPYEMGEPDIAKAFGMSIKELRDTTTIANNAVKSDLITQIRRLEDKGISSPTTIAKELFGPGAASKESLIRGLQDEARQLKVRRLAQTADLLRQRVEEDRFIDVGRGQEHHLGVPTRIKDTALAVLKDEGYNVHNIPAAGASGRNTTTPTLTKEDWKTTIQNSDKIVPVKAFTEDKGASWNTFDKPIGIDPARLQIVGGKEGAKSDGVIYVRPGVKDLDMGGNKYLQTRIQVGDKHYLKGMAVLKDDLPAGVDLQFHTNKSPSNKLDALKPLKGLSKGDDGKLTGSIDQDMPFGSTIRQMPRDPKTGKVTSAIHIVNEEHNWDNWSKTLSSQMLSKQKPELVKSQLNVTYAKKKEKLDEILALTNPAVKKKLLDSYADDLDSAAVHMKAASLPRQETKVILPINSLKPGEVYAPTFRDGEKVALIRYPHGGIHEIPELTVNNRNAEGNKYIGKTGSAAIGIHHSVAGKLSGADFDGDTVVVIPNNSRRLTTSSTNLGGRKGTSKDDGPLGNLRDFDTQDSYGKDRFAGVPYKKMSKAQTQTEMGRVSNLITDMTIKGASDLELARAVKHSMVVIDAEKHGLNYQQSYKDHGILALKRKYQDGSQGGASTIVSKSTGDRRVNQLRDARVNEGGRIDPKTGKRNYVETGKTYNKKHVDADGNVTWTKELSTQKVARGRLVDDAHDLISKTSASVIERHYADYSNDIRALANTARLELLKTPKMQRIVSAAKVYHKEVASLEAKLKLVEKKAPQERQAQRAALAIYRTKKADNPNMTSEEAKKVRRYAINTTRARLGLTALDIKFTPREWEAIQAGAVSESRLKAILAKADMNQVKVLATPRTTRAISTAQANKARSLLNNRYTLQEVADELGVSVSTLKKSLED